MYLWSHLSRCIKTPTKFIFEADSIRFYYPLAVQALEWGGSITAPALAVLNSTTKPTEQGVFC